MERNYTWDVNMIVSIEIQNRCAFMSSHENLWLNDRSNKRLQFYNEVQKKQNS